MPDGFAIERIAADYHGRDMVMYRFLDRAGGTVAFPPAGHPGVTDDFKQQVFPLGIIKLRKAEGLCKIRPDVVGIHLLYLHPITSNLGEIFRTNVFRKGNSAKSDCSGPKPAIYRLVAKLILKQPATTHCFGFSRHLRSRHQTGGCFRYPTAIPSMCRCGLWFLNQRGP